MSPLYKIKRHGLLYGYRWGHTGHTYPINKYGKTGAKAKALRQGRAIHARGGA